MLFRSSKIIGDRQLGDTGRIFYRYDHKSGATRNDIYRYVNDAEYQKYIDNYDPNRGGDKYLAEDMTEKDDPFYNFNPQE